MIVLSYNLSGFERQEERFADAGEAAARRSELERMSLLPNPDVSNISWGSGQEEQAAPPSTEGTTISIHIEVTLPDAEVLPDDL